MLDLDRGLHDKNSVCYSFKVYYPKDRFFSNRVISVISVVLRESNLTISDSTGEPVSLESEKSASGFP